MLAIIYAYVIIGIAVAFFLLSTAHTHKDQGNAIILLALAVITSGVAWWYYFYLKRSAIKRAETR